MPLDTKFGSRQNYTTDDAANAGTVVDPGPHLAIVKENADSNRSGRIRVFIPALSNDENDPVQWISVRYASPFMGSTTYRKSKDGHPPKDNNWYTAPHTYGMWFTPPDLENQVLVVFANGNRSNGFYFACVMPNLSKHMVPAIARSDKLDKTSLAADLKRDLKGKKYPTTEFNEWNDGFWDKRSKFLDIVKPIHEPLARVLLEQGLEDDLVRGTVGSSAQRESPSGCFGISTPGRASPDISGLDQKTGSPKFRLGGHSLVMDDGDASGNDCMIRLRTASGHQIMMNDSEGILYIGNLTGTSWLEFTSTGKIHLYSDDSINFRAKQSINLHSDKDINMYAANNIKMLAGRELKQEALKMTIKANESLELYGGRYYQKSGSIMVIHSVSEGSWKSEGKLIFHANEIHLSKKIRQNGPVTVQPGLPEPPSVEIPASLQPIAHPDATKVGLKWLPRAYVNSISEMVPTHEPWIESANGIKVHDKRN
jgi:hypothetical protein